MQKQRKTVAAQPHTFIYDVITSYKSDTHFDVWKVTWLHSESIDNPDDYTYIAQSLFPIYMNNVTNVTDVTNVTSVSMCSRC